LQIILPRVQLPGQKTPNFEMKDENPKTLLRAGQFVVIEFIENPNNFSSIRLSVADEKAVRELNYAFRTPLLINILAWIILAQQVTDRTEERFIIFPTREMGYPDEKEMIGHVVRTCRFLEGLWPMESEFVHQCVTDDRTALMLITPCPVHGGLFNLGPMIPFGNKGMILRHPSPFCYYPRRKEEQGPVGLVTTEGRTIALSSDMMQNLFGVSTRRQEKNMYDLEFPLP